MRVVVGIDLGSTTTKAVLVDQDGQMVGQGITNSRSDYEVACRVALDEARTSARFAQLERALDESEGLGATDGDLGDALERAFRLELYLDQLGTLNDRIDRTVNAPFRTLQAAELAAPVGEVLEGMEAGAASLFEAGTRRKSDFFRDIAGEAFMTGAEDIARATGSSFERLSGLFDRAILEVETQAEPRDFRAILGRAAARVAGAAEMDDRARADLDRLADDVAGVPIDEAAFVGTGYGRQTLPFPASAVRSEILCHGRGAHRVFPETRTVLDIGGQDTKAIQVDDRGVVTSFQMNDRCAAGCGRYLGYIADELNIGVHELGPLALGAKRVVKVNSTCTVFAGAELRERLALGQRREDVLAGLHRAIMLRAMSLLARSGGIDNEFTFTGGVCNNPMATRMLRELMIENYGEAITLNAHPDSIYMGALGAALFALDDARADRATGLPGFAVDEGGGGLGPAPVSPQEVRHASA